MSSILIAARNDEDLINIINVISTQEDFKIVGIENDEFNTIIKSERLKPDVLIMDLQPPGTDGVELAPIIHRKSPSTSIIIICDKDEENYSERALMTGALGFLLKNSDMDKLPLAVRTVQLGVCFINNSIIKRSLNYITYIKQFPGQFIDMEKYGYFIENRPTFSPLELSIITYIANGFSDKEIAEYLNYSAGTIRNYVTVIKQKTKLKNRTHIATYSLVYGLINLNQFNKL
jgi:DNA-binding NarL/FixJ family response regulator